MSIIRESFDSQFDIKKATVEISSVCSIEDSTISTIYDLFNKYGFILLSCSSAKSYQDELGELGKYFGQVIPHKRSDINGISTIKVTPGFPDYFGTTNEDTGLHTDGACSKQPPNLVVFQCETPSQQGGETQLLSCKLLYEHIRDCYPELLKQLFDTNAFTITRDNETKANSVFSRSKDKKIFTIFRANGNARISVEYESQKSFDLVKQFVKSKQNILQFKLKKNQMLIIDNTCVMHGRSAFPKNSQRKLNRLFMDGNISKGNICLGFEG